MGYHPTTRSRDYREGWLGRRRTYKCRTCGEKFQVDTLGPLTEKDRHCHACMVEAGRAVNPYHAEEVKP